MPGKTGTALITGGIVGATVLIVDMMLKFIPQLAGIASNTVFIAVRAALTAGIATLLLVFLL